MSTKIYNGYKLPLMSVKELNTFILRFKEVIKEAVKISSAQYVAHSMIEMIDDISYLEEKEYIGVYVKSEKKAESLKDCKYHRLFNEVIREGKERYHKIKRTNERDPIVDFDCELSIIPLEDKILVLFYSEQREITSLWESMKEVSFYGYWNNTDPDENCSEEEWKQRRIDWNKALPGLGIPSENGMTVKIYEGFPEKSEIDTKRALHHLPSFERRVSRIAQEVTIGEFYEKEKEKTKEEDSYQVYLNARRKLGTEEGKKRLEEVKKEYETKLVKELDEEIFRLKFDSLKEWISEKTSA